jgi:hypothetical protein
VWLGSDFTDLARSRRQFALEFLLRRRAAVLSNTLLKNAGGLQ